MEKRNWKHSVTLKQRMVLCLAAFFAAFALQLALNGYQARAVQQVQDDQMGNFNAISRFQGGVESSISILEAYRWENGETEEMLEKLQAACSTSNAWLWRIRSNMDGLQNVSDAQQMWRVLDGSIGDEFLAILDGMDLVGLSWFDAGVRSFYTREKVTGLDDLQGLTIRVQESDMMSDMITALGAKPAQVVYSKVYAALHNAEIDGAENNWPSYEVMGHYEVAPFFLKDEHTRVPEVQLASPAVMEKLAALDESFPEVIRACARESAQTERELWARREANAEQNMRKRGICVTELDEAEKARFRAAVQPMYDGFSAQQELIDRIQKS